MQFYNVRIFNFRASKWLYLSEKQLIEYWKNFAGLGSYVNADISDTDSIKDPSFNSQEDLDHDPVNSSDSEADREVKVINTAEEKRAKPDANLLNWPLSVDAKMRCKLPKCKGYSRTICEKCGVASYHNKTNNSFRNIHNS